VRGWRKYITGGPLVVQQDGIWKVAGVTARILNAYDPIPNSPTCAISYNEMQQSEDGYVNVVYQLDWITSVTGLSVSQLTAASSGVNGNSNTSASSPESEGYQTTSSAANSPSPNARPWFRVTLVLLGMWFALS
jgi:hypothetical protein